MFKSLLLKGRLMCILILCTLSSLVVTAQTRITGKVIGSDDKQPVIGATVKIKGTNAGAVTDVNGVFTLNATTNDVLVISYIGYQTKEVPVTGPSLGTITLTVNASTLNEVVVTGYTSQRKKDITGAVAIVDVTSMKTVVSGNATSLLQGQASGVTVTNSGMPGAATSINIRGIGSIFSTSPLVIIDGVEGNLDNINVNDIESIQVLKDAGSGAIYGIRAAEGVVVVTTKKGKQGKATITYDGSYGTQRPLADGFKVAGTQTYMQAEYLSHFNDGLTGPGNKNLQFDPNGTGTYTIPDFISPAGAHTGDPGTTLASYTLNPLTGVGNQVTAANKVGTDWFHEVFKPAPIQQHNITASGGNDKSTYLMSLGYLNQGGTLLSQYEKRYSLRANTNFNIADHIRIGENAYMFYKQNPTGGNQNEGNIISQTYREPPIIPVYDIAGNFAGTRAPGLSNASNPYAVASRFANNSVNNDWQMTGNVFGEVDFLKHFNYRMSFGGAIDNYYYHNFNPDPYENAEGNTKGNSYTEGAGYNSAYTWGNYLTYNQIFGKHNVKVLLGSEAITKYGRQLAASRGNYLISVDPNFVDLDTGSPSTQQNTNNNATYSNTILSYFARVEYQFNDKYLFTGNVRRDGSSFFSPSHQYGTFPSGTIGWRISKEDFLKSVTWINDVKIRAGYGTLGSLNGVSLQPYNAYNLYNSVAGNSFYDINGTSTSSVLGTYKSQIGNLSTTWETNKESNIGVDATILNNKIDFTLDFYKKTVTGLLFKSSALAIANDASQPYKNAGNLQNTGIDFNVTYHGNVSDFKYNLSLNLSHYSNLVNALAPGTAYEDLNSAGSTRLQNFVRLQPGQPVGEFFGYQQIGLYQSAADVAGSAGYAGAKPGLIKYRDVNGDGKIDANDRTFIGNPNPKFTGGFNLQANYKNFDLNAFFYGVYGNKIVNYVKYWVDFPQVFDGNVSADIITNSWKPGADNSHATIPVLTRQANLGNTAAFSSYYIENGSFLRLKSLQIGYSVPSEELKHIGIAKFRIFVLANNLFTITKYDGLDPELQPSNLADNTSFGIDFGNYPSNEKRYTIGVQATF